MPWWKKLLLSVGTVYGCCIVFIFSLLFIGLLGGLAIIISAFWLGARN